MKGRAAALGFAFAVASAALAQPHGHVHRGAPDHRFDDAERWARVFDDPARDAWQQPEAVIRALELAPDATVADIGAGTGYFAVRLARAVPGGRVVAVDTSPDMVRYLGGRAQREGLPNLIARLGAPDDPQLAEPVDLALLVDVYHHIPARERYFERVRAGLTPVGRLVVIDFRMDATRGPPPGARIAPERVKAELARAGFELVEEHGFLPEQYFLVFRPAGR
jgi:cyclopropane fatty-acyl-phospholipid synthase-like methyltransferase